MFHRSAGGGVAHHGIMSDQACGIYSSGWWGLEGTLQRRIAMDNYDLANVKTVDLVSELEKREGVVMIPVEPYKTEEVSVNGPAIILIVDD